MKKTILGRTGMDVSRIALGGFPFGSIHKVKGFQYPVSWFVILNKLFY